ncbi:MAG: aminotransferase class V-fold PLP-dependent enzyme, partial [Casimicrobiaceae bacterium]
GLPAPLVVDASSHFLSRPMPVAECGLIYAGAQKNVGPAGVTVVVVREDLIGRSRRAIPSVLDYAVMANAGSLFNTPPTFAIYVVALTLRWIKREGGLGAMEARAVARSEALYAAIDRARLFRCRVRPLRRSAGFVGPEGTPKPRWLARLDLQRHAHGRCRGLDCGDRSI